MSNYILDKAYVADEPGGIHAACVVVPGDSPGTCCLPLGINASRVLGVTLFQRYHQGQNITVRKAGIARCLAAEKINYGDPVMVANSRGYVCTAHRKHLPDGYVANVIGFAESSAEEAGDIVEVFLSFHQRHVSFNIMKGEKP